MDYQQAIRLARWVDSHQPPRHTKVIQAEDTIEWVVVISTLFSDGTTEAEMASSLEEARAILGY